MFYANIRRIVLYLHMTTFIEIHSLVSALFFFYFQAAIM